MKKINNPDNLPQKYIEAEVAQAEQEHRRTIRTITFRDNGDGTCTQVIQWDPIMSCPRI